MRSSELSAGLEICGFRSDHQAGFDSTFGLPFMPTLRLCVLPNFGKRQTRG